jgi:glucan biosynthesis protein C
VGLLLLLPPQFYLELRTNAGYRGSFWGSIPSYLAALNPPRITPWPETLLPVPFSGHLWYLQYLFLISLSTLPLLLYLRSRRGQRWLARLAGWCDQRGGIFLFLIPLALALVGLRGLFEAQRSWADWGWYAIFFVIGYLIPVDERFTHAIKRHGWLCLALWLLGFSGGIGLLVLVGGYDPFPGREPFSWRYILYQVLWSLSSWSAVVFMLSMGARYLTRNHKLLAYANEAVLPFYLLHQTVILIVGWWIIPLEWPILPKYLVISIGSFALIMALYELLIRRINPVRFLFGMRLRKRKARSAESA